MTAFFRFPHTPHLAWLGSGSPRDDKVLSPEDADALLAGEVVIEEKVDGANIGFSVDREGELRVQNRGSYLDREHLHPQFRSFRSWLPPREHALIEALGGDRILFGEWCFAVHSVAYDQLPDWFLGFDVYDRATGTFWDTARRDSFLVALGLHPVPRLAEGCFTVAECRELLGESRVGRSPMEGLIVRKEAGGHTTTRAKLVRAEFTQAIDEHWSRRALRRNQLADGAYEWP
jgi:hypothetical protein